MSYRVLVCHEILLSLASEEGWLPDLLKASDDELQEFRKLYGQLLLEPVSRKITLIIPSLQVFRVHLMAKSFASRFPGFPSPDYVVSQILRLGSSHLGVHEEVVLSQAQQLSHAGKIDFAHAALMVYANMLRADAIITSKPETMSLVSEKVSTSLSDAKTPIINLSTKVVTPSRFFREVVGNVPEVNGDFIYPLTPKLTVKQLPKGSTPVDFAYAIHSEVGHRCIKARVNDSEVPLNTPLNTGDVVEIKLDKHSTPDPAWLEFAVTSLAQRGISRGVRQAETKNGWRLIEQALGGNIGPCRHLLQVYADKQNCSTDELAHRIGSGLLAPQDLQEFCSQDSSIACVPSNSLEQLWELATCCHPLPTDRIVGMPRSGHRPTRIHRCNCSHLDDIDPGRLVEIEWPFTSCSIRFSVFFRDRADVLRPILNKIAVSSFQPNLRDFSILPGDRGRAIVEINLNSRQEWENLSQEIRSIAGVQQISLRTIKPFI